MQKAADRTSDRPPKNKGALAPFDGDVLSKALAFVDSLRTDEAVVVQLLDNVSAPTGDSRYREDGRVKRNRNTKCVVGIRSREVYVREKALLILQNLLNDVGHLRPFLIACAACGFLAHLTHNSRAAVADAIFAVAEAHDLFLAGERFANPRLGVLD